MIEIDEVFEVRMVCGARCGTSAAKIWCLSGSLLGRRLDDEVGGAEGGEVALDPDAGERCVALGLGDACRAATCRSMLPRMISGAALSAASETSWSIDVEAREREDMGDAVAHLAGTDHADALDLHEFPVPAGDAGPP